VFITGYENNGGESKIINDVKELKNATEWIPPVVGSACNRPGHLNTPYGWNVVQVKDNPPILNTSTWYRY